MKNKEVYKEKILEIATKGCAIAKTHGELVPCSRTPCIECDFISGKCREKIIEWANAEFEGCKNKKTGKTEWQKVPVDTPVIVRYKGYEHKRYFAGITRNANTGKITAVKCFKNGRTSWSSNTERPSGDVLYFNPDNVELAKMEDAKKYRSDE